MYTVPEFIENMDNLNNVRPAFSDRKYFWHIANLCLHRGELGYSAWSKELAEGSTTCELTIKTESLNAKAA